MAIKIVSGQTAPVTATLSENGAAPVGLAGSTVQVVHTPPNGTETPLPGTATITDTAAGLVSFTPGAIAPGTYYVRWKVTNGGAVRHFPNDSQTPSLLSTEMWIVGR